MTGRITDIVIGINGKQRITLELDGDFRNTYDELHDEPLLDIDIRKHRRKRSNDANAMMWSLCEEIAKRTGTTKEAVYRQEIREVGEYTPMPIREDAVESFQSIWASRGVGWVADVIDNSKIPGYKLVFAYHGSSLYDSKQMSRLIDNIVQDAKALGIDTISEQERSMLLNAWTLR